MNIALVKEINKQYLEATICYEEEIKTNPLTKVDWYINLTFIYWSFAFLFRAPEDIPEDYSMIGGSRYQKILGLGLEKFPNNLELHFWEIYFNHIIYGKEFTQNDCLSLIEKYNKEVSLVPYFFLYQFDKIKYKKQRDDLINEIELVPTAKNLYIKSLLL
jgi:hypothetical protein